MIEDLQEKSPTIYLEMTSPPKECAREEETFWWISVLKTLEKEIPLHWKGISLILPNQKLDN